MADTAAAPAAPAAKPGGAMARLKAIRAKHGPLKNTHKEVRDNLSWLNKVALFITERVGTFGFFLLIFAWTIVWLGWNTLGPSKARFDPAMGFVLYLFICNVIQILLMPLIMVGQNLQGMHSEARAEHDLEVNIKAEQEIEVILQHLEQQNEILLKMVEKLGVDVHEVLDLR
ncbi:MAG TPA: DUF1003 domain-containing protein [Caulobacteraceae bacterium]|nr:DUF1003 domain-containing protein [Caulobacteraceae bacterium]